MNVSKLHMIAYTRASAVAPTSYEAMTAIADGILARVGTDRHMVPVGMKIIAAYATQGVATWTYPDFRINAPSLLRVTMPLIVPIEPPVGGTAGDPNVQELFDRPLVLKGDEGLGVDVRAAVAGTAGIPWALLMLADELEPVPAGEASWFRGIDATTTTVADAWSPLSALAWDETLGTGVYAVIGAVHIGPVGAVAARLQFNGASLRPGTISVTSTIARTHRMFMDGSLGVLGTFNTFAPPSVEVLGTIAAGHRIFLRVIKIG